MGIGTSLGAFHEDDFRHEAAPWFLDPKDDNVIDPQVDPGATQPLSNPVIPVDYKTASPLVTITDEDIEKGMSLGMSFSGGGLGTKPLSSLDPRHLKSPEAAEFRLGQLLRDKASTKKAGEDVSGSDYMYYNAQIRELRDYLKNLSK